VREIESTFASHPLLRITSADRLEIRARILAAARQRFARFSHQETSIVDIARAAALPADEVRLHFADIRALMVALQRALDGGRPAYRRPQSTLVKARLASSLRKDAERTGVSEL
jgi:AcrR family transcriptional regulator